jgi:hypothetical protein
VRRWSPYGLRRFAATAAFAATGSEAAALLGLRPRSTIIQRYSRDRLALARRAADGIGALSQLAPPPSCAISETNTGSCDAWLRIVLPTAHTVVAALTRSDDTMR